MVPDLCTFHVDIRLTPALDDLTAAALLLRAAANADAAWPETRPTDVEVTTRWPPFALPDGSPLRDALLEAAGRTGLAPAAKIAGPSNIGNYLAGLAIPATAGFGVNYQGLHGTDERIRLDSIPIIQAAYHQALLTLLHTPDLTRQSCRRQCGVVWLWRCGEAGDGDFRRRLRVLGWQPGGRHLT